MNDDICLEIIKISRLIDITKLRGVSHRIRELVYTVYPNGDKEKFSYGVSYERQKYYGKNHMAEICNLTDLDIVYLNRKYKYDAVIYIEKWNNLIREIKLYHIGKRKIYLSYGLTQDSFMLPVIGSDGMTQLHPVGDGDCWISVNSLCLTGDSLANNNTYLEINNKNIIDVMRMLFYLRRISISSKELWGQIRWVGIDMADYFFYYDS